MQWGDQQPEQQNNHFAQAVPQQQPLPGGYNPPGQRMGGYIPPHLRCASALTLLPLPCRLRLCPAFVQS